MPMSLEKHLVFYGTYHSHPVNLAIHMCTVPLILFAFFTLLSNSGPLIPLPAAISSSFELSLSTIAAITLGTLYILLEPVAGFLMAALCIYGSSRVNAAHAVDPEGANKVAMGVLAIGWSLQLVGNAAFEKHIHEKISHVVQAVFVAPLFVWFKVLFALGYRSELQGRVKRAVEKELAKIKSETEKKKKK